MTLVISRLPKAWRNKETLGYLNDFLKTFLARVLDVSKETMGDKKKMLTIRMLMIGMTKMGFSVKMSKIRNPEEPFCVTQTCVQNAIAESGLHVKKNVRVYLRMATEILVKMLVEHASVFQKPVTAEPDVVVRKLRGKMNLQN